MAIRDCAVCEAALADVCAKCNLRALDLQREASLLAGMVWGAVIIAMAEAIRARYVEAE
ncbi:MAG TPA: hypothetical protein VEA38_24795 [Terriglobales bacterium]|nr:hypothetical protein [Terriglobales bacterium]